MREARQGALPPGWALAPIGHLTSEGVSQAGPALDEFTYIDISSIDNDAKVVSEPKILERAHAPSRARQQLQAGDVLVSMTRPNLNAVAMVPGTLEGKLVPQDPNDEPASVLLNRIRGDRAAEVLSTPPRRSRGSRARR